MKWKQKSTGAGEKGIWCAGMGREQLGLKARRELRQGEGDKADLLTGKGLMMRAKLKGLGQEVK